MNKLALGYFLFLVSAGSGETMQKSRCKVHLNKLTMVICYFLSALVKPCSHVDKGVSITSVKKGIKNAGGSTKLGQCQVSENLNQLEWGWGWGC